MKQSFKHIAFTLLLLLVLISCHNFPEIDSPPVVTMDSGPINLDYDYTNSITKSGWVRFINMSSGIVNYDWDFGFQENGESVKSYSGAPKIRFPSNGNYNVSVSGISYLGDTLMINKVVTVSNY